MDQKKIADALKAYMEERNIKQIRLAEIMGISQPTLSNIINGRFPLSRENALSLCRELPELDITFLLTGEGTLRKPQINQTNVNGNNNVKVGEDIRRYADAAIKAKDEVIEANRQVIEANTKLLEAKEQIIELLKQLSEK